MLYDFVSRIMKAKEMKTVKDTALVKHIFPMEITMKENIKTENDMER